jgi:alkylhydroperoxidase/carboxymuconolactone decarboxylase family protein YurZ
MHLRAALRNGLTREELREIILQVGLYAGVPAANHGIGMLRDLESE